MPIFVESNDKKTPTINYDTKYKLKCMYENKVEEK